MRLIKAKIQNKALRFFVLISVVLVFASSSIFSYASSQSDSEAIYVVKVLKTDRPILHTLYAERIHVINSHEYYIIAIVSRLQLYNLKAQGFEVEVIKSYSRQERKFLFAAMASSSPTLENEYVSITINSDGAFTMQRSIDDKWLLYPSAGTTAFSMKVDEAIYWTEGHPPISTSLTIVDESTAYIEYTTSENVHIRHIYSLAGEAVKFEVQASNEDSYDHHVQVRYLFDTQVDVNDGSPLYAQGVVDSQDSTICTYETDIRSITFSEWKGYDIWPDPGLISVGNISTIPSRMVFAWWPNAIGYSWNYTPDPNQRFYTPGYTHSPNSDSCVLIYLDLGSLSPGETATSKTYYGIGTPLGVGLEAVVDALHGLRKTVKNTINFSRALAASKLADVVVTLRPESSDAVITGLKIATSVAQIAVNPGITATQIANTIGISRAAAGLLIDITKVLSQVHIGYNGIKFAESLDAWWQENESFLLNEANGKEAIVSRLEQAFEEEFDMFVDSEGHLLSTPGSRGLKDYLDSKFENYITHIRTSFSDTYPVATVVAKLQSVKRSILNSQSSEALLLPINDEMPQEIFILGSPLGLAEKIDKDLSALGISEWVSLGLLVGTIGKVALVAGSLGLGAVAEFLVFAGLTIASTATDIVTISTEESIHIESQELINSVVCEMATISRLSENFLDYLILLEQRGWIACNIDNNNVQIVQNSFNMENIQIPLGQNSALINGSIEVSNVGLDTIQVITFANIYRSMSVDGNSDSFPIMIAKSDPYNIPPGGASYTLNLHPTTLLGSDAVRADNYIGVAYLGVGPSIIAKRTGPVYDEFYVNSYATAERTRYTTSLGRSSLSTGEQWESSHITNPSTVYSDITLFYPGSDLDLHVYNSLGNHVGINYNTGNVDIEIPGAIYSGSTTNPEIIRLPQSGGELYTVRVVAMQTSSQESFEVIVSDVPFRESILSAFPSTIETSIDLKESNQVAFLISAKEVGGQTDYIGLVASCTDLVSSSNVIPSSNITIDIPSSSVPAGSAVEINGTIDIPAYTPSGTYAGSIFIGGNSVEVPISLDVTGTQYTLTIGSGSGGTTNPSLGSYTYDSGTEVAITAIPESAYRFSEWTGDVPSGHKNDNPITINMDSDKSITANFIRQYGLTVTAGSGGTTDPAPGSYTHDSETEIAIRAIPNSGYQFSEWSGNASGTANPITITMDSDKTIKANFVKEESLAGKKDGCFIATAAYGHASHPHLNILRDFRNTYLMSNKLGRSLVDLYYKYSPFVANLITKHKTLKVAVRISLLPMITFSYLMLHFGLIITTVMLSFIFMLPVFLILFFWRRLRQVEAKKPKIWLPRFLKKTAERI